MFSWNYTTDSVTRIGSCNPIAVADVVGDWREEMLYYDATAHEIKIGTAITVTSERFYTFMQDPIFRNDVSSTANGYQNSNYTTFYMGSDTNLQDDADGDLLVNLAEYAIGGDPSEKGLCPERA